MYFIDYGMCDFLHVKSSTQTTGNLLQVKFMKVSCLRCPHDSSSVIFNDCLRQCYSNNISGLTPAKANFIIVVIPLLEVPVEVL